MIGYVFVCGLILACGGVVGVGVVACGIACRIVSIISIAGIIARSSIARSVVRSVARSVVRSICTLLCRVTRWSSDYFRKGDIIQDWSVVQFGSQ